MATTHPSDVRALACRPASHLPSLIPAWHPICTQTSRPRALIGRWGGGLVMIRKLKTGQYRLYSRKADPKTGKRRNLGTFATREQAEKHERAVQFFKHQH